MGYDVVEFHGQVEEHYKHAEPHIAHKMHGKHWVNAKVTKVWLDKSEENVHIWKYQIHVKTEDGAHHEHHYTILYEVHGHHGGKVVVGEIHEGLQPLVHCSK